MEIQQATASINNEDQNTQKEADISDGNENNNDELVIEIEKIFERQEIQSSVQCCIYKVPRPLRKWNEEAYTPQLVSVGPFHHENKILKAMEEHKARYFRSFMERSALKLEYLVRTIREMEESIRGCYEETINLTSDSFVKMVLLDAGFILELFIRHRLRSWTSDDLVFVLPRANAIMLDLLLLENQLPFFVFETLHQLASPFLFNNESLLQLSFDYFKYFNDQGILPHPNVKIEHFTDLLRTFKLLPLSWEQQRYHQRIKKFYTATQLHEAGVKFQVGFSKCCLDIKFDLKKGVLEIPSLELDYSMEVVIRNIMALEQTRYIENAYFTDYFLFMDSLIKTGKDVDLLCEKNILVNFLGDSDAVKSMTSNLNKGITRIMTSDNYFYLLENLCRFYENPWNRWKALLIRTYFTSSSDFIYVVLNIVVMTLLTIIQAVCSVIQVAGPSSKPK